MQLLITPEKPVEKAQYFSRGSPSFRRRGPRNLWKRPKEFRKDPRKIEGPESCDEEAQDLGEEFVWFFSEARKNCRKKPETFIKEVRYICRKTRGNYRETDSRKLGRPNY